MSKFNKGDIVSRKSYKGDVAFEITNIIKDEKGVEKYVLRGLQIRLEADAEGDDLVKLDADKEHDEAHRKLAVKKQETLGRGAPLRAFPFKRFRDRPGRILHVDSSEKFLDQSLQYYREAGLIVEGKLLEESLQPQMVMGYLEQYDPDVLVVTGHDGMKKHTGNINSMENYRNSRYFVKAAKEARKYQPDFDKLCIFAGACQSYFEAIMSAGANFASSPGRILIYSLDPAIVSSKVSLTESSKILMPVEVAKLTASGKEGIGGIRTKGHKIGA